PVGPVAAVCIWPRFVEISSKMLAGTGIKVATVVNFPCGGTDAAKAADETKEAISRGAAEIDVVLPYRAFMTGDESTARTVLTECKKACADKARLKVILESGSFDDPIKLSEASHLALDAGADFLKTSTGKAGTGATLEAARIMMTAIKNSGVKCGFKASGGVRDSLAAARFLALAEAIMGKGWATPDTFRFGASGLLDTLLSDLGMSQPQ
ncbi:MAG: deoxyribose-phosphate aldolase, partial [Pseudomonadota bacterium]|nr:deoxyribose-phosphate aldolase [Pseudomonadota bacterium]